MGKLKSLIVRAEFDTALSSHNCQANANHRITKGDRRLKVRNGRSWDHYCMACAGGILASDTSKLEALMAQARRDGSS